MKSIMIRDLRRRWSEMEAALQVGEENLVTRDSGPVAKLVRVSSAANQRPRANVVEHIRLMTLDKLQAEATRVPGGEMLARGCG